MNSSHKLGKNYHSNSNNIIESLIELSFFDLLPVVVFFFRIFFVHLIQKEIN